MTEQHPARLGVFRRFLSNESSAGIILIAVAALALIVANSGASEVYFDTLHRKVGGLSVEHWVNDALMALFFLLVGLEIKREFLIGQLSTWGARILPGAAAVGGMAVPAVIFVVINSGDPVALRGWAVPTATDIAFALGVLSLLGSRVPTSLKVFLTALAILDDLGAVVIIAVFYTEDLDLLMLGAAAALLVVLIVLNRLGVTSIPVYLAIGAVLWYVVFLSGIHATLAGVALALTIPIRSRRTEHSPLERLEHGLSPWVAFLIVPIFGFANAGVALGGSGINVTDSVPLGVALGLFVGKQVGVFGAAFLFIRLKLAPMPTGANMMQVYGVAVLCGIGFTMSLFIGLLAYSTSPLLIDETKIGVLLGSGFSAVVGAAIIILAGRRAGTGTMIPAR
ncbi:MAG: Na+/H+ antiporter NhaA [Bauldia sp.]|nr:Na+/H+ antiporter NhaA [Bauldia sp.]MCW5717308.1 Na+/H+ antiporter NhaA [Bauldia sp.]